MVWRFSSQILGEDEMLLKECPVGKVLRETPDIYAAIETQSYAETGAVSLDSLSPWMAAGVRFASSERARLWEIKEQQRQQKSNAASDAAYARKAIQR